MGSGFAKLSCTPNRSRGGESSTENIIEKAEVSTVQPVDVSHGQTVKTEKEQSTSTAKFEDYPTLDVSVYHE